MQFSCTQKFTFAVLFTLASSLATLCIAYGCFGTDAYGNRIATVWSLQHDAEPVWPQIEQAFKKAAPSDDTPLPQGDVQASLAGLLRNPVVDKAFFVDHDGILSVKERIGSRMDTYRVDLRHWVPKTLNLLDRFRYFGLNQREEFIYYLLGTQRFSWNEETQRFLPIRPDNFEYLLFSKGDRQAGYLGYELDDVAFNRRYGTPLLARYGLDQDLQWNFVNWDEASLTPARPLDTALHFLRLQVSGALYDGRNARVFYTCFVMLIGALSACVLGISACIRQGRGVLNERAIALAQSNFVSAVSHEMRTPLTTIRLYAEMLEQGLVESPEKRTDYMRTITRECDRLTRLIENVLDFAKISRRSRPYRFEEVDLEALLKEASTAMRGPLERACMTVDLEVVPGLKATLDRDAVLNAITNLLSNAIKYAPDQPRIVLGARAEGASMIISVRDFGPGIPTHEQRRIFKPFYRMGDELTRQAPGSGLGLALVQEYARAHGGKVELVSQPGAGATFRLVLPQSRKTA